MKHIRSNILLYCMVCCLFFFLAACGSGAIATGGKPTPTAASQNSPTSLSTGSTSTPNVPPDQTQPKLLTQTNCPNPASDSARAAVMSSLARGSDPAIAYIFNSGTQANPVFAELKWYDVAKGSKTVITHLPNDNITEAKVSTDGRWILFVTNYPRYAALQLVRMDGQGLQTLYCTTRDGIQGVQWSPNQSQVIFSVRSISGLLNLYLLTMANGKLQRN